MKVVLRTFGPTYGWSSSMGYAGPAQSWNNICGHSGGAVMTDVEQAPEFDARTAWKSIHRLRRLGFIADIKH